MCQKPRKTSTNKSDTIDFFLYRPEKSNNHRQRHRSKKGRPRKHTHMSYEQKDGKTKNASSSIIAQGTVYESVQKTPASEDLMVACSYGGFFEHCSLIGRNPGS